MKTSICSIAIFLVASSAAFAASDRTKSAACLAHERKIAAAIEAVAKDKSRKLEDVMVKADPKCRGEGGGGGKFQVSLKARDLTRSAAGSSTAAAGSPVQLATLRSLQKSTDGSSIAVAGSPFQRAGLRSLQNGVVKAEMGGSPVQFLKMGTLKDVAIKSNTGESPKN